MAAAVARIKDWQVFMEQEFKAFAIKHLLAGVAPVYE